MKILVIQLRRIGDILLTTPVLPYLKNRFPGCELHFLCEPCGKQVLETNPNIDRLHIYDKDRSFAEILAVRRRRYDVVIDFMTNPRSGMLTLLSGAPRRVGYRKSVRRFFYNWTLKIPSAREYVPARKLRLAARWVASLGVEENRPKTIRPDLVLSEADRAFAKDWMRGEGLASKEFVVMAPAHRHPIRQWRPEAFEGAAERCFAEFGLKTYVAWGPGEKSLAERLRRTREPYVGLLPPTTIRQMAAIMENAAVVLTNDSGNMHTAVSVGTPTVTVYGPTRPVDWNPGGPRDVALTAPGLACLGCHLDSCPVGHLCMKNVHAADAMEAIRKLRMEEENVS